mmetsp:Transcript_28692/g.40925  ORF Transcript_28692/g.40925 Transcript_28692/m.40925 type:complete len:225 (-) Transcript_28692:994-1668(-)
MPRSNSFLRCARRSLSSTTACGLSCSFSRSRSRSLSRCSSAGSSSKVVRGSGLALKSLLRCSCASCCCTVCLKTCWKSRWRASLRRWKGCCSVRSFGGGASSGSGRSRMATGTGWACTSLRACSCSCSCLRRACSAALCISPRADVASWKPTGSVGAAEGGCCSCRRSASCCRALSRCTSLWCRRCLRAGAEEARRPPDSFGDCGTVTGAALARGDAGQASAVL